MAETFNRTSDSILFFTPEAAVLPHYVAQLVMARTLRERGFAVLSASCQGLLRRCPVKDMVSAHFGPVDGSIEQLCADCRNISIALSDFYNIPRVDIADSFSSQDQDILIGALSKAAQDLINFEFEGVKFGKICYRDLSLSQKISDYKSLSVDMTEAWLAYIAGSLTAYLATLNIIKKYSVRRVVRFNEYATNLGALFAAYKCDVPVITTSQASHLGVDRRRMVLMSRPGPLTHRDQIQDWSKWRDIPLNATEVAAVAEDITVRTSALSVHTYSPKKTGSAEELLKQLSLSPDRKLLAAFTSSLDEDIAYHFTLEIFNYPKIKQKSAFKDQIEWLSALVNHVENSSDLQLAVRVHPREGSNKRDGVESQHLKQLRSLFGKQFKYCRFIWPEDPISSYDLIELADVGLTSWSTVGLEMGRLGVPSISAWGDISFPDDKFMIWGGATESEYFQAISKALVAAPDLEAIKLAFRCYHQFNVMKAVDFSDIVPRSDFEGPFEFRMPANAAVIEEVIVNGTRLSEINLNNMKDTRTLTAVEDENSLLIKALAYLIDYFCRGKHETQGGSFIVRFAGKESHADALQAERSTAKADDRILILKDKVITYDVGGSTTTRYSPMLARLGRVIAS